VVKEERKKQGQETTKVIKEQQAKFEPTTLGDMAMFSQLKEQLQDAKTEAKAKAKVKAEEERVEETKVEEAKVEEAKVEEAKVKEAKVKEVKVKEAKVKEAKVEEAKVEEAKVEETKVEETKVEETKVEETKVEETKEKAPVEEAPVPKAARTPKAKTAAGEDLKIIEGIGPKIEEILHKAGIHTYAELASTPPDAIREILLAQGSRFKMFDPETWPAQAQLAADGKWDELQVMKDSLQGGRK
jgi:predicted flap endonuclease-1-like 5' DNA nuclease